MWTQQTTRAEHIAWARERALAELDGSFRGISNALASIASDLGKHPQTADHPAGQLMTQLAMRGELNTDKAARQFLEGIR